MRQHRGGFTLFELILAIALSATLLALIGTAINLYLMRVDASRTRVEEAQLARAILAMIAEDIRATTIYQPQDTSAIAQLMANSTPFDVDSIDAERTELTGGTGATGGTGTAAFVAGGDSASSGSSMGSSSGSSSSGSSGEMDATLPLGLNGTFNELYADVTRLPRSDELFSTLTGYSNAPLPALGGGMAAGASAAAMVNIAPPSDLKTVRYFVRSGAGSRMAGVAATSLGPELQQRAGGLVRQEIPRNARVWAELSGNSAVLDSGQTLVSPEVVNVEFRYFDGQQVIDTWDMLERRALPLAIEVRIWLASSDAEAAPDSAYDRTALVTSAREFRQTVYLPMADVTSSDGGAGGSDDSSSTSSSGSSSSGDSSSFGSSFGSSLE